MFSGLDVVHAHPARRWTALVSFTLQAALVGTALVLPLLRPAILSEGFARRQIFVPPASGVERPPVNQDRTRGLAQSNAPAYPIVVRRGPSVSLQNTESLASTIGGPTQIVGICDPNSKITSILNTPNAQPVPSAPVAIHRAAPVSVVMEGNLLRKIEPRYPVIAREARIQGTVSIKALISKQGAIERALVVNGSPLLAAAALEAVRQWRYRPYYLNGEPVEVETEITVNFVLNR